MFHVCGYLTDEIRKGKHFAHAGMLIRNRMMTDKFWDRHSFLSVNFIFSLLNLQQEILLGNSRLSKTENEGNGTF